MLNSELVSDYVVRSAIRLKAIQVLLDENSWADAVSESREVVELMLKALLRSRNIAPPKSYDVSPVIKEQIALYPVAWHSDLTRFINFSRQLRRDRELAFYGSEDLTPSKFYQNEDAVEAFGFAKEIVTTVTRWVG